MAGRTSSKGMMTASSESLRLCFRQAPESRVRHTFQASHHISPLQPCTQPNATSHSKSVSESSLHLQGSTRSQHSGDVFTAQSASCVASGADLALSQRQVSRQGPSWPAVRFSLWFPGKTVSLRTCASPDVVRYLLKEAGFLK